jgi:hypothetical protein
MLTIILVSISSFSGILALGLMAFAPIMDNDERVFSWVGISAIICAISFLMAINL